MQNVEFKVCTKCSTEKCLTDFTKNSAKKTGYEARCKACTAIYLKEYAARPENIEKARKTKSDWKKNNRDKVNAQDRKRAKVRRAEDPLYCLVRAVRGRISEVCKTKGVKKFKKSMKYLGCTVEEFKAHLEKQFVAGMTWENHAQFGWHIDHIKPIASFDLTDPKQQEEAFHFTNLQPLWWDENLAKNKEIRKSNV